jgi:transcriptional regulator with XRE-family HTH domain
MIVTGAQVRDARSLLRWPRIKLASLSDIGVHLLRNIEAGERAVSAPSLERVRSALEAAGIEFDHEGHGVRMREGKLKSKPDRPSETEGHAGTPKQAHRGRKQTSQEFADGDHVVYDGPEWKGAVSRRGAEWLAVNEGGESLGYFADKALAVKAVLDAPAPPEMKG